MGGLGFRLYGVLGYRLGKRMSGFKFRGLGVSSLGSRVYRLWAMGSADDLQSFAWNSAQRV